MPVLVDDLLELDGALGQAGDVPDQHEVRPTGRHISENPTAPLRGAQAERDLRNGVDRYHTGTIAPVLQLTDLPIELGATVRPSVENGGTWHMTESRRMRYAEGPRSCPEPSQVGQISVV